MVAAVVAIGVIVDVSSPPHSRVYLRLLVQQEQSILVGLVVQVVVRAQVTATHLQLLVFLDKDMPGVVRSPALHLALLEVAVLVEWV